MNKKNQLDNLIKDSKGLIKTNDVVKNNIPKKYLYDLVEKNMLFKEAHGIYAVRGSIKDELYLIQCRSDKLVFSHETALYLHDLIDRDPLIYSVTVPRGYSTNRLRESKIDVITIREELFSIGIERKMTVNKNFISVYNLDRTIIDIIRKKNKIDKDIYYTALKNYSSNSKKNIIQLMDYARLFKCEKTVRASIEGFLV